MHIGARDEDRRDQCNQAKAHQRPVGNLHLIIDSGLFESVGQSKMERANERETTCTQNCKREHQHTCNIGTLGANDEGRATIRQPAPIAIIYPA